MPRWWIRLLLWYCGYTWVWIPIPDRARLLWGCTFYRIEKGERYMQSGHAAKIHIDTDYWPDVPVKRLYIHKSLLPHLKTGNLPYIH